MIKIGFGFDIHKLVEKRKLILGGVRIDYNKGLLGHSDADVLIHAVCDAILGALGQGDIGEHFPDTDAAYKDIASTSLLEDTYNLLVKQGYVIGNVDTMIVAQEPKLAGYKEKMKENLAKILHIKKDDINIKAGTAEGLGAIGEKEAIAAYAVVTLKHC
jgi:2-C-methyl-D-erythritol 2,4-cyclodiphosphate synthase